MQALGLSGMASHIKIVLLSTGYCIFILNAYINVLSLTFNMFKEVLKFFTFDWTISTLVKRKDGLAITCNWSI